MTDAAPASIAAAYSLTGGAWDAGPGRIYNRLAEVLVGRSPIPLAGRLVLDVGAGTGAASRAVAAAGGRVVALDVAEGMLAAGRAQRPPAVVADAARLPVAGGGADAVVAAFSYNHVDDVVAALAEARRAVRAGGGLLASTYGPDDDHPAKAAVAGALAARGFTSPAFEIELRRGPVARIADPARFAADAVAAGWVDVDAERVDVAFPELGAAELVEWRLGMAQHAWFVAGLGAAEREEIVAEATAAIDGAPPLVRPMIVLTASRAARGATS